MKRTAKRIIHSPDQVNKKGRTDGSVKADECYRSYGWKIQIPERLPRGCALKETTKCRSCETSIPYVMNRDYQYEGFRDSAALFGN